MTTARRCGIDEALSQEIIKVFESVFGSDLQGLVLYGSAVGEDYQPGRSDLNLLAVLAKIEPKSHAFARRSFLEWQAAHRVAAVYLTPEEVARSQDVFPMEFLEMQRRRRVLAGRDFLKGLSIWPQNLRHQIEYELRGTLLMLRRHLSSGAGGEVLEGGLFKALSSCVILAKSYLHLEQADVPDGAAEALRAACARAALDPAALDGALRLRELRTDPDPDQVLEAAVGLHEWLSRFGRSVDAHGEKDAPAP